MKQAHKVKKIAVFIITARLVLSFGHYSLAFNLACTVVTVCCFFMLPIFCHSSNNAIIEHNPQ